MAKHRKGYRSLHWLLFLYFLHAPVIPSIWASPDFTPPTPSSELVDEVAPGTATNAQFTEIQNTATKLLETDQRMIQFFDTKFASGGDYGELQTGALVEDWESMAKLFGVSTAVLVAAYGLWRRKRADRATLFASGDIDQITSWLEGELDTVQSVSLGDVRNSRDPDNRAGVLRDGTVLRDAQDWENFASARGIAGMGAMLMSLYLLWKRREQLEEEVADESDNSVAFAKNPEWEEFESYVSKAQTGTASLQSVLNPEDAELEAEYAEKLATEESKLVKPQAPQRPDVIDQYEVAEKSIATLVKQIQQQQPSLQRYQNQVNSYQSTVNNYQNQYDQYRARYGVIDQYERYQQQKEDAEQKIEALQGELDEKSAVRQEAYQVYLQAKNERDSMYREYYAQWNNAYSNASRKIIAPTRIRQLQSNVNTYTRNRDQYRNYMNRYRYGSYYWWRYRRSYLQYENMLREAQSELQKAQSPEQQPLREFQTALSDVRNASNQITSYERSIQRANERIKLYQDYNQRWPGRYDRSLSYAERDLEKTKASLKQTQEKLKNAKALLAHFDQSTLGADWQEIDIHSMLEKLNSLDSLTDLQAQTNATYNQAANDFAVVSRQRSTFTNQIYYAKRYLDRYRYSYQYHQKQASQYLVNRDRYAQYRDNAQNRVDAIQEVISNLNTQKTEQESIQSEIQETKDAYDTAQAQYESDLATYKSQQNTIRNTIANQLNVAKEALREKAQAFWDWRKDRVRKSVFASALYREDGTIRNRSEFENVVRRELLNRDEESARQAEEAYLKSYPKPQPPEVSEDAEIYKEAQRNKSDYYGRVWREKWDAFNRFLRGANNVEDQVALAIKNIKAGAVARDLAHEHYRSVPWYRKPYWLRSHSSTYSTHYYNQALSLLNQQRSRLGEDRYQELVQELKNAHLGHNRSVTEELKKTFEQHVAQEGEYNKKLNEWNQNLQKAKNAGKLWDQDAWQKTRQYHLDTYEVVQSRSKFSQSLSKFTVAVKEKFTTQAQTREQQFESALNDAMDLFNEQELENLRNGANGKGLGFGEEGIYPDLTTYIEEVGQAKERADRLASIQKEIQQAQALVDRTPAHWNQARGYRNQLNTLLAEQQKLQRVESAYQAGAEDRSRAEFYSYDQIDFDTDLEQLFPDYQPEGDATGKLQEAQQALAELSQSRQEKIKGLVGMVSFYKGNYRDFIRQIPSHIRYWWTSARWSQYRASAYSNYRSREGQINAEYQKQRLALEIDLRNAEQLLARQQSAAEKHNRYAAVAREQYAALRDRVANKKRVVQFLQQLENAGQASAYFTTLKTKLHITDEYEAEIENLTSQVEGTSPYDEEIAKIRQEMSKPNGYTREEYYEKNRFKFGKWKYVRGAGNQMVRVWDTDMWALSNSWKNRRHVGWNGILDHMEQKASNYARSYRNATSYSQQRVDTLRGLYERAANYKLGLYKDWPKYYRSHPLVYDYQQQENQKRLQTLVDAKSKWESNLNNRINDLEVKKASVVDEVASAKSWLSQTAEERVESTYTDTIVEKETALLSRYQSGEDVRETIKGETALETSLEGIRMVQENAVVEEKVMSEKRIRYSLSTAQEKMVAQYMGAVASFEQSQRNNASPEGRAKIMRRLNYQSEQYWGAIKKATGLTSLNAIRGGYVINNPSTFNPSSVGGSRQDRLDQKYGTPISASVAPIQPTSNQTREESAESNPANNPYWNPSETPEWAQKVDKETIRETITNYREQRRQQSIARKETGVWQNVTTGDTYAELKPEQEEKSEVLSAQVKDDLINLEKKAAPVTQEQAERLEGFDEVAFQDWQKENNEVWTEEYARGKYILEQGYKTFKSTGHSLQAPSEFSKKFAELGYGNMSLNDLTLGERGLMLPIAEKLVENLNADRSWWQKIWGEGKTSQQKNLEEFIERAKYANRNALSKAATFQTEFMGGVAVGVLGAGRDILASVKDMDELPEAMSDLMDMIDKYGAKAVIKSAVGDAWEHYADEFENGTPREKGKATAEVALIAAGGAKVGTSTVKGVKSIVQTVKSLEATGDLIPIKTGGFQTIPGGGNVSQVVVDAQDWARKAFQNTLNSHAPEIAAKRASAAKVKTIFDQQATDLAKQAGVKFDATDVKSGEEIARKLAEKDLDQIKDVVRGRFVVENQQQLDAVKDLLTKKYPDAGSLKDDWNNIPKNGYRKYSLSPKIDGQTVEIQIVSKNTFLSSDESHKVYEKVREMQYTLENNDSLTNTSKNDLIKQIQEKTAESKMINEAAWAKDAPNFK